MKHWILNIDADNIAWLGFDKQDSEVNTLDPEVLQELQQQCIELAQQDTLKALVFYSLKYSGFIAGADINVLAKIQDIEEARTLIRLGQSVFDQIAALPQITVALIQGFCMGGGLELALACDYRIAVESDKRCIALPEVKLGIFPGWGGSVRLPRLIGAMPAMDLILSGRALTPRQAKKMRVVDFVTPERHSKRAVLHVIQARPPKPKVPCLHKFLNRSALRPLVATLIRSKTSRIVLPQHYPAPFIVIDNWKKYGAHGDEAFHAEAEQVTALAQSSTAKNLLRVFQLQDNLKQCAKQNHYKWQRVHVVGAGVMGGDIAAWCAVQGFQVTLQDSNVEAIGRAIQRASDIFTKKLKQPRAVQVAMDRLTPDSEGYGITTADVIIEAIFEEASVKRALFKDLEVKAKADAMLATNTSSILLREIASDMQDPTRLVGIHFFNPVARMPLVEVVHDDTTAVEVLNQAIAFVKRIDKLPLPVQSAPGFLVNRILMAYLMEAVILVEEGVPLAAIDKAAVQFGMPMGPIELADKVGLDICLSVATNVQQVAAETLPTCLTEKVAAQHLGCKTGRGFYQYSKTKVKKPSIPSDFKHFEEITQRLVLRYLNEAMACWREGIVDSLDKVDAGMIFGTGFAPFRGGPIHYAQSIGLSELSAQFAALENKFGARFVMDRGWQQ